MTEAWIKYCVSPFFPHSWSWCFVYMFCTRAKQNMWVFFHQICNLLHFVAWNVTFPWVEISEQGVSECASGANNTREELFINSRNITISLPFISATTHTELLKQSSFMEKEEENPTWFSSIFSHSTKFSSVAHKSWIRDSISISIDELSKSIICKYFLSWFSSLILTRFSPLSFYLRTCFAQIKSISSIPRIFFLRFTILFKIETLVFFSSFPIGMRKWI